MNLFHGYWTCTDLGVHLCIGNGEKKTLVTSLEYQMVSLGQLLRSIFVKFNGRDEPCWSWRHYELVPDNPKRWQQRLPSLLHRVEEDFWVCHKCPS